MATCVNTFAWETTAKKGIDETNHLTNWLLECIRAQRFIVTEDLTLYEPAYSPKGIPYHKSRESLFVEAKRPLQTMYDFLVKDDRIRDLLPPKHEYLSSIDFLFTQKILASAVATVASGTSRVPLVSPSYRYRPFRNCMVDVFTSKVYTPSEASAQNLFGYHYMDVEVPTEVIHVLVRLSTFIEQGFPTLQAFFAMRDDIAALVDDTAFKHYWDYEGYNCKRKYKLEKKCSDIESLLFMDGLYHVGDLAGAKWIVPLEKIAPDIIAVYLSQAGGTRKSAFSLERQLCDERRAIWFIPMSVGSDVKEYSGSCESRRRHRIGDAGGFSSNTIF